MSNGTLNGEMWLATTVGLLAPSTNSTSVSKRALSRAIDVSNEGGEQLRALEMKIFAILFNQFGPAETLQDRFAREVDSWVELDERVGVSEAYEAGLLAVSENETGNASEAFAAAWEQRDEVVKESVDSVAVGVALLAHVDLNMLDPSRIDESAVSEAVERKQDDLSEVVLALYDFCTGEEPRATPEELNETVNRDDTDKEEFEKLAFAGLLKVLLDNNKNSSGRENPSDEDLFEPDSDDLEALQNDYERGLEHTAAGERQAAIILLMDAWDRHDSVSDDNKYMAYGAGVALAVHVADDPALSMIRDEVLEVLGDDAEPLSYPADIVHDATTGGEFDVKAEELYDQIPEGDGLDALEYRAFGALLELVDDSSD